MKELKIAVIGAGVSGLTTAYLLKKKNHKVTVFEKSFRCGGYIGTHNKNGFIVEIGANGFLNNEPKTLQLIETLGLQNQVIESNVESKLRYLYFQNKLHRVPENPKDLLKSKLVSFSSKLKIFKEQIFPPIVLESYKDMTVYDLFKRHFGEEIAENIVRTALVGIYAGDAKKLLATETVPKLLDLIKTHRSLLKGLKEHMKISKPSTLHSFKNGMQTLIDKLSAELKNEILLSTEVVSFQFTKDKTGKDKTTQKTSDSDLSRQDSSRDDFNSDDSNEDIQNVYKTKFPKGKINLNFINDQNEEQTQDFDEVVVCTPLDSLQSLFEDHVSENALMELAQSPISPVRTISVAFTKKIPFQGFGVLISPQDNKNILGFLHSSDIFKNRAPADKSLVTLMLGGDFKPELLSTSTQNSLDLALKDLTTLLGPLPPVEATWFWNHQPGISQYTKEATLAFKTFKKEVEQVSQNIHLNLQCAGGVSINDCIKKSFEITEKF